MKEISNIKIGLNEFQRNCHIVEQDGQYGILDDEGKAISEIVYDQPPILIENVLEEPFAIVHKPSGYGLLDICDRKILIQPEWDSIERCKEFNDKDWYTQSHMWTSEGGANNDDYVNVLLLKKDESQCLVNTYGDNILIPLCKQTIYVVKNKFDFCIFVVLRTNPATGLQDAHIFRWVWDNETADELGVINDTSDKFCLFQYDSIYYFIHGSTISDDIWVEYFDDYFVVPTEVAHWPEGNDLTLTFEDGKQFKLSLDGSFYRYADSFLIDDSDDFVEVSKLSLSSRIAVGDYD